MSAFTLGDLEFLSTIVSDELFTPSIPWRRRGGMPATVMIDGQAQRLQDVPVPQYGPEWWWCYFWTEAKGRIARARMPQKNALLAFFNKAFVKPGTLRDDSENERYVVPRGALETVFAGDMPTLRAAMDAALEVGFESIDRGPEGIQVSSEAMEKHVLNLNKRVEYKMAWRGGEREWASVRRFGFEAAARYDVDAVAWNMRQPWHPFHDVAARSKIHIRKAHTDNCLFSAVSVTDDWRAAVCYPKIEQTTELLEVSRLAQHGTPLRELQSRYPGRIARLTYPDGKVEYKLANQTRIALMILEGVVFNTAGWQKEADRPQYPELGAQSIVGSNVVAMLEYTRVFHGFDDAHGFTAFLNPSGTRLIDRADLLVMFGDEKAAHDYYSKILTELDHAKMNRISLRWQDNGVGKLDDQIGYWKEVAFGDGRAIHR